MNAEPKDRTPAILAVAHQKGGTGKTTTVCNLAACFAGAGNGYRVVVIDLDPQAAASHQLSQGGLSAIGSYEVIVEGQIARGAIQLTKIQHCLLIPATDKLIMSEIDATTRNLDFDQVRERLLENLRGTDLIIVDCPAGFGTIATMAMVIADLVLIPTTPLHFETIALRQTIEHLERLRRNARSRLSVVLTMCDSDNAAQNKMSADIRAEWKSLVSSVHIPRDPAMEEALVAETAVVDHQPQSQSALAYGRLAVDVGHHLGFEMQPMPETEAKTTSPRPDFAAPHHPAPATAGLGGGEPPDRPAPATPVEHGPRGGVDAEPALSDPPPAFLRAPETSLATKAEDHTEATTSTNGARIDSDLVIEPPASADQDTATVSDSKLELDPDAPAPLPDDGELMAAETVTDEAEISAPDEDIASAQETPQQPSPDPETAPAARPNRRHVKLVALVAVLTLLITGIIVAAVNMTYLPWVLAFGFVLLIIVAPLLMFRLF